MSTLIAVTTASVPVAGRLRRRTSTGLAKLGVARLPGCSTMNPVGVIALCRSGGGLCEMSMGFNYPERDAEHWRRLEAEALTLAASMTDAEPRRVMHFIAAAYCRLAERAELRKPEK